MSETTEQLRIFNARVERVISPSVIDVYVGLGMGVMILKRVTIDHAPSVPRPSRPAHAGIAVTDTYPVSSDDAMQCLIILCGGKKVRIEAASDSNDFHMIARVGVRAKLPPREATWNIGDTSLLDVGQFMSKLASGGDYDVVTVRTALNGPQKHTQT